jgi:REP element-mobilizing transposase RayT
MVMARQLRREFEGAWHHVMSRGFQRQPIFLDDKDRLHFLELLGEMVERYHVLVHAYVLMENHYHVLLQTPGANASRAMQWLNVSYSVWFNRHHLRTGAVFQSRYKSVLVEGDGEWALSCCAYIHLNPVRIQALGLGKTSRAREKAGASPEVGKDVLRARLEMLRAFPWSSHRAYAGLVQGPGWLTSETLLSRIPSDQPRIAYQKYMEQAFEADPSGADESFLSIPVLGSMNFQTRARGGLSHLGVSASNMLSWKRMIPFDAVVRAVEQLKGENWDSFVNRHGDWGRDMALHAGRHYCGMTLRELGGLVGVLPQAVGQVLFRFSRKLSEQPELREAYTRLQQRLQAGGEGE